MNGATDLYNECDEYIRYNPEKSLVGNPEYMEVVEEPNQSNGYGNLKRGND